MNKIMVAMILAGAAVSAQAAPSLVSDAADASLMITAGNKVAVSNVLSPENVVPSGYVNFESLAQGSLSADDGLPHSYAVTFPDDIIITSDQVRGVITGANNPDNKLTIQLGEANATMPVKGTEINGKKYLLLANKDANSEVRYGVYTAAMDQNIQPDTYNIRTQAYVYSE